MRLAPGTELAKTECVPFSAAARRKAEGGRDSTLCFRARLSALKTCTSQEDSVPLAACAQLSLNAPKYWLPNEWLRALCSLCASFVVQCPQKRDDEGLRLMRWHLSLVQQGLAALLVALQPGAHVQRQLLPARQLLTCACHFQSGRHLSAGPLWLHASLHLHLHARQIFPQGRGFDLYPCAVLSTG